MRLRRSVVTLPLVLAVAACSSDEPNRARRFGAAAPPDGSALLPTDDASVDGDASKSDGGDAGVPIDPIGAGAHFPIMYDLGALSGTVRYVAPGGSDTTGTGAATAPYATLAKAIASAAANDSIVVRGGTYRQGNLTIGANKPLTIVAYPGETPIFNGAMPVSGGWTTEGGYKFIAYTPKPVTNGSGICFTTGPGCPSGGQNLAASGVGKFPDQAWIGNKTLQQVTDKASLAAGKFYVDATNSRLYLIAADADLPDIEVSDRNVFMSIQAPKSTLRGVRITRFSNTASDYGVVNITQTADQSLLEDVEVSSSAFISVLYQGSADLNVGGTMRHVTIKDSNWMGVSAAYTDDLTLEAVDISGMNPFDEFTWSPQSGAFKTARTRRTKVIGSYIHDNRSHGLWFDQSNLTVDVAHCRIVDNAGSGVFFEISDDFLLVDSYVRGGDRPVKLAGSSGLKLVNNTVVGGADPIGVYTDSRSMPGCADPSEPLCPGSYSSERDTVRPLPPTMDWMPRVDLMLDNVVAYPTASGYCSAVTPLCVTLNNASATVTLESVLHKADSARGIPETRIDGNVYANGAGTIIAVPSKYNTVAAFGAAMGGPPVNIAGFEASGRDGDVWVGSDGAPTSALSAVHGQAVATPVDARINAYVPAGTRHFGVLGL